MIRLLCLLALCSGIGVTAHATAQTPSSTNKTPATSSSKIKKPPATVTPQKTVKITSVKLEVWPVKACKGLKAEKFEGMGDEPTKYEDHGTGYLVTDKTGQHMLLTCEAADPSSDGEGQAGFQRLVYWTKPTKTKRWTRPWVSDRFEYATDGLAGIYVRGRTFTESKLDDINKDGLVDIVYGYFDHKRDHWRMNVHINTRLKFSVMYRLPLNKISKKLSAEAEKDYESESDTEEDEAKPAPSPYLKYCPKKKKRLRFSAYNKRGNKRIAYGSYKSKRIKTRIPKHVRNALSKVVLPPTPCREPDVALHAHQ